MKKILFILLAIHPILVFAQQNETAYELPLYKMDLPIDTGTGLITFTYMFHESDILKDELFDNALDWFSTRYNAVEKVLVINDKENGKMVGKPFTDFLVIEAGLGQLEKMYYTIKIDIKDGKYSCEITDIKYQLYPSEHNLDPEKYSAEEVIIKNLYKNNGKVRSANLQYKENTIKSIQSLVLGLQQAMNPDIIPTGNEDF
jgi:hypothetical protein